MRKLTRNRRKTMKVKLEPEKDPEESETRVLEELILCRVCESTKDLIDISWQSNAHFHKKLRQLSCLSEDDPVSLLKFICRSCGERLEDFSTFRILCEITYKKLLGEIALRQEHPRNPVEEEELPRKQESFEKVSLKQELIEESKDFAEEDHSDDQNIENSWTEDCSGIKTAQDTDISNQQHHQVQDEDASSDAKEEESSDKKNWLQCRICKIRVKNRYHMEKHQWKHKGRSLKCTFCQVEYSCQGNLTRHIRVVHEKRRGHICNICGKTFSQSNNLKLHLLVHQDLRFDCDVCEKSFKNPRSLRNHKILHIPVEDRPERIQKRTGKRSNVTPWKTKQRCQKKMCICPTCGKISNYVTQHESHMRSHTGEKPFKCAHCDKTFRERNTLRSHMLLHTGEKPYKCITCGATFRQSSHLRRHIRSHTGEKPYKCLVCEKSFTEKSILTTHMRVHTGEKPFHCRLCPKKFHNARVLRRHYPKVHFKNQNVHTQSDIQRKLSAMQMDMELISEEEIN